MLLPSISMVSCTISSLYFSISNREKIVPVTLCHKKYPVKGYKWKMIPEMVFYKWVKKILKTCPFFCLLHTKRYFEIWLVSPSYQNVHLHIILQMKWSKKKSSIKTLPLAWCLDFTLYPKLLLTFSFPQCHRLKLISKFFCPLELLWSLIKIITGPS